MDEADALEALSHILERITEDPYNISLHVDNVRIARDTGMEDQVESALDMVTAFWAAGDYVWLPLIESKISSSNMESRVDLQTISDLFEKAEQDYVSIPLLQKHLEFVIDRHEHFRSAAEVDEDGMETAFTTPWTRAALAQIVSRGIGDLSKSHLLWDARRDWETEMLQSAGPAERAALVDLVETMLLERLQQPHFNHDETFQAYSTFTTNFKPQEQYELLLVKASKLRTKANQVYEAREPFETTLARSGFSLAEYANYIMAERRKKPNLFVVQGLYERAITEADKRRWAGEAGAEEALPSFWAGYLDFIRTQNVPVEKQEETCARALRSVPASGEAWARYIRLLEQTTDEDTLDSKITEAYEKTKTIKPLQADVEQVVPVVLAYAGYLRRSIETDESGEDRSDKLVEVLMDGISRVRAASTAGDPRLRLEKFFSAVCLKFPNLSDHALIIWEDATRHYKTSYLAWTSYTEVLIKKGLYDDVRKVFRDICMKNLDWPEAMWDAWISFEQVYGSVESLEDAFDRIERAQVQITMRRAKEAEKAEQAARQLIDEQQMALWTETAAYQAQMQAEANAESVPMEVDSAQPESSGSKRKADADAEEESSKKQRTEQKPLPLKRDRENCTVFVADLPAETEEEDLAALFKDCGSVREIKVTQLPNTLVAIVEFVDRDSVPAALTKDKKRVHEQEVAVHLAWRSTLYVTNFPESADDAYIRDLFTVYGTIFDVRWPSKKFKATRRFCYVQYTSPESAEAALELHGRELEPGLSLNVFISNPERKKERTDRDANDREIYVAGLSKPVTKEDLEKLFRTYGLVKEVRMALENGRSKGFAFVEFEQEQDARAALAANNFELKKRRIAVTLADTRFRAKKDLNRREDLRARSVRVRNLPPDTQEGLLQQALEKLAPVKRVEVFSDKNEAEVEFESASDVGKLLLRSEPITFNGSSLELIALTPGGSSTLRTAALPPATSGSNYFVPRTAASRPRAGLGSKKRVPPPVSGNTASTSTQAVAVTNLTTTAQAKSQDDFRKMLGGG
ncbi:hypothetical protein WOLCODRAFT_136486 [Wolfiporia cocos MD-104 SS10]|uniref:U4/U6 snRNA-associated-splicing factor PRP24 n=1 Tax=Wolfiporia cocos (strain MD-104) TaxID=742152 RepID=A0A2H3JBW3_WOLCO|nr:hypothetical protein WOLCODRAFT_136486 [Wolfiporia cocos MD-104 SS10]